MSRKWLVSGWVCVATLLAGCSSDKGIPQGTGFLSDYSKLRVADESKLRYVSPKASSYSSFIIDPVDMKDSGTALTGAQKSQMAAYFDESLGKALTRHGLTLTSRPGPGVGRIRLAITSAGKSGASMEGEIVDSVNNEQVAAVVQSGKSGQFALGTFSAIDEVKGTIDKWTENAATRIDELRTGK